VAGIGEEGQGVGEGSSDDLAHHERRDQAQRCGEVADISVRRYPVRMAPKPPMAVTVVAIPAGTGALSVATGGVVVDVTVVVFAGVGRWIALVGVLVHGWTVLRHRPTAESRAVRPPRPLSSRLLPPDGAEWLGDQRGGRVQVLDGSHVGV
jgi:hypothetical protein